jgi:hypothetical protein
MPRAFETIMPSRWVTCTPSDATDLTGSIGIYVGGAGNVSARTLNDSGTTVIFTAPPVGTIIPGNFTRIMAATTATAILVAFA